MKTLSIFKTALFASLFVALVSCTDEVTVNNEPYFNNVLTEAFTSTASDQALKEAEVFLNTFLNEVKIESKQQKMIASGPNISLITKPDVFPQTHVIDFGNGYTNANNLTFSGQVIVTKHDVASRRRTFEYSDFYINKDRVHGGKTIEVVEAGVLNIITEEKVEPAVGKPYYRYSERTRARTNDNKTPEIYTDDSFEFTGFTKGTNSTGIEYSLKIEKPIVSVAEWKYFVSGTIVIETERGTQYLDFGDGEMDNIAISTINGVSKKIELKW